VNDRPGPDDVRSEALIEHLLGLPMSANERHGTHHGAHQSMSTTPLAVRSLNVSLVIGIVGMGSSSLLG
jgi:hypothetical protein